MSLPLVKTKYVHLRYYEDKTLTAHNRGGATIGIREFPQEDGTVHVHYAFSYCCLKDNFCRKIGRAIVDGRLDGIDFYNVVYVPKRDPYPLEHIIKRCRTNALILTGKDKLC